MTHHVNVWILVWIEKRPNESVNYITHHVSMNSGVNWETTQWECELHYAPRKCEFQCELRNNPMRVNLHTESAADLTRGVLRFRFALTGRFRHGRSDRPHSGYTSAPWCGKQILSEARLQSCYQARKIQLHLIIKDSYTGQLWYKDVQTSKIKIISYRLPFRFFFLFLFFCCFFFLCKLHAMLVLLVWNTHEKKSTHKTLHPNLVDPWVKLPHCSPWTPQKKNYLWLSWPPLRWGCSPGAGRTWTVWRGWSTLQTGFPAQGGSPFQTLSAGT